MTDALRPRLPAGLGSGRGRAARRADDPRPVDLGRAHARPPEVDRRSSGSVTRPTTRSS